MESPYHQANGRPLSVREYMFNKKGCSESLLAELARDHEGPMNQEPHYWVKSFNFVERNQHEPMEYMSDHQKAWIEKICIGLIREARR